MNHKRNFNKKADGDLTSSHLETKWCDRKDYEAGE